MSADFNNQLLGDNWPIRRRVLFLALIWLACCVTWLIVRGADTALNQQLAMAELGAFTTIIMAYVFGAVWDDREKRRHLREWSNAGGPGAAADTPNDDTPTGEPAS